MSSKLESQTPQSSSSKKKVLIALGVTFAVIVLIGAAIGTTMYVLNDNDDDGYVRISTKIGGKKDDSSSEGMLVNGILQMVGIK